MGNLTCPKELRETIRMLERKLSDAGRSSIIVLRDYIRPMPWVKVYGSIPENKRKQVIESLVYYLML